jgi:glycosyltransferase involved in cell wall biosynthesis
MTSAPVTAVILTYDEEANLSACLESVAGWTREMFVVDSGSRDATHEIARRHGATVVVHPFETHAKQWNWAFQRLPISTEWVLALDADQRATPELASEITAILGAPDAGTRLAGIDGFYIQRRQVFRGRFIRHGGYQRKYLLKLFRVSRVSSDENELLDFRFYVHGRTLKLASAMIEDNRKEWSIGFWIDKHNQFASRQAEEEWTRRASPMSWSVAPSLWGTPDQRTLWLKSRWYGMPLYVRPVLYFVYRYVVRLGFLDGKEGFVFHFLQAFWYRLLVDIKLDELRKARGPR